MPKIGETGDFGAQNQHLSFFLSIHLTILVFKETSYYAKNGFSASFFWLKINLFEVSIKFF